jgi:putative toxin-antitoxin system toxin component, PIN family
MRVVLDTNVILSALLFDGVSSQLHQQWKNKVILPLANRAMIKEYARVLAYRKFKLTAEEIAALFEEEIFPFFSIIPTVSKKVSYPPDDLNDVPFLHAALDGAAKVLVSGDSHLIDLNGKYLFPIVSPAEFLKKY